MKYLQEFFYILFLLLLFLGVHFLELNEITSIELGASYMPERKIADNLKLRLLQLDGCQT